MQARWGLVFREEVQSSRAHEVGSLCVSCLGPGPTGALEGSERAWQEDKKAAPVTPGLGLGKLYKTRPSG